MARSRMRLYNIPAAWLVLLVLAGNVRGERKYVIGAQLDAMAGWSNRGTADLARNPRSLFYAGYPSLQIQSTGEKSELEFAYTSGPYGIRNDLNGAGKSHAVNARLSRRLGPRWKMAITDSFSVSSDLTSFNVFSGSVYAPDGPRFRFEPFGGRRSTSLNTGAASFDWELGPESSLSFGIAHDERHYEYDSSFAGRLSDQWGLAGHVLYTRKLDRRRSWTVRYGASRHSFREFDGALTHSASVGYSYQPSSSLSLSLAGGPSYTEALGSGTHYAGYNTSLSIVKSIRSNSLSLSYQRESGDSTGLGSVSDVDSVGVGFVRALGRRTTIRFVASAFNARHLLDNPLDVRGLLGSAGVDFRLGEHWSINVGGSYQRYAQTELFDANRGHVFVSLRLHLPGIARFAR